MELRSIARKTGGALRHLHWMRGLRAGLAVSTAMIVCHLLGKPMGWAALGGFEAILVDNGGPYRSRFRTIATLMVGGALACFAGAAATASTSFSPVLAPMAITAAFCFAVTFGRVVSQPVASTSVIILVIYFAALGSSGAFGAGGAGKCAGIRDGCSVGGFAESCLVAGGSVSSRAAGGGGLLWIAGRVHCTH
jgi:hypothetical protein